MGATYRGKHSDEFGLVVRTNPGILPEIDNKLEDDVPGMDGSYYINSEYGTRTIELEVGFIADDYEDYSKRLRKLADWLRPDEGPGPYVADHEPDKTYYAVVKSVEMERVERIAHMGKGTIELVCPDPFAYSGTRKYDLSDSSVIKNEGTADSYPVFNLEVTEESEIITITNNNHTDESGDPLSISIGTETDIDDDKLDKKRLVLHDTMQSTSDWTKGSEVDSGIVSGTMKADSDGFYADDYGEDDADGPDWVGPALKRELDETLESFRLEVAIKNYNETKPDGSGEKLHKGHVGIIEVYLLDVNDEKIAKMQFGDTSSERKHNRYQFVMGDKRYQLQGRRIGTFNDFDGIISFSRDTGYFYPRMTKVNKNGTKMLWFEANDGDPIIPLQIGEEEGQHEVKSIQVAARKYKNSMRLWQRIKEIKLWSTIGMYEYPEDEVVVEKFEKGDKIYIDTSKDLVLVNGEKRTDLIQMGSDMFSLLPGENILDFSESVKGTIEYQERNL